MKIKAEIKSGVGCMFDESNTYTLSNSKAKAKILLDANVLIYSIEAYEATGLFLLDYLDSIEGRVDWFAASTVLMNMLNNRSISNFPLSKNMLNTSDIGAKMDRFPYTKEDGSLGFVKLNSLASDDWEQICLAYNYPELIIVTNDSKMFKCAHLVLDGRCRSFHKFLEQISPYWDQDPNWATLKQWFIDNKKSLKNNTLWTIEGAEKSFESE